MWSNLVLASALVFLSSISQLDISGDKTLLRNSVPDSVQLLKQEFRPQLQANYANSNQFYARWLRSQDFNIAKTRVKLSEFVNWRQNHILNRGRRDLNVPFQTLQDKNGETVLVFALSNYNFRKLSEEDHVEDYLVSVMRTLDTSCESIYSRQQAGQNISHYSILVDWTGFNANDHLCPQCIRVYLDFVKTYEANYPLTANKLVHVKAPKMFMPIVTLMKTFMSDELRNSFIVFYRDEDDTAKEYLDKWLGKSSNIL